MTQTQWLIAIICAVVLSLIVTVILELIKSQREKPVYRALADSLNFTTLQDLDIDALPRKDEFALFSGKDSQYISYILSGTIDTLDVRINRFSSRQLHRIHQSRWLLAIRCARQSR